MCSSAWDTVGLNQHLLNKRKEGREGGSKEQSRNSKWWCVRDVRGPRTKSQDILCHSELPQGLRLCHLISSSPCLWHVTASVLLLHACLSQEG